MDDPNPLLIRFPDIRKHSDKFSRITHPEDQLRVIANATSNFLQQSYNLKDDQVNITILHRRGESGWSYLYKHHEWRFTPASEIIEKHSAARHCLDTGDELFIPDKIKAARDGHYHLTRRDKRRGDGSAYVFPLRFVTPTVPVMCLVSVVTYGTQLCYEYEQQTVDITKAFLREFVRRFEVELCLHAIKTGV
jgi:hypothetical protein